MENIICDLIRNGQFDKAYEIADQKFKDGDFDSAYEIYDEIYEAVSDNNGRNSPKAFEALANLAEYCYRGGKYKDALSMYEMYLDYIDDNYYNKIDTDYYYICTNVARIYEFYGDFERAKKIKSEKLSAYLKAYGDNSVKTIMALGELAFTVYVSGDYANALKDFEQQYEMALKSDECGEEQYCRILQDIGRCYDDLCDFDKALKYFNKAYNTAVKAYGEKNHDTLSVLNDIACVYSSLYRTKEELETREYIYKTMLEIVGEELPDTVMAKSNLASACQVDGQFEKAYQLKTEVYEWFRYHYGDEHNDTLLAMGNLAIICDSIGRAEEALELREKVYRLHTKTKGQNHPATIKSSLMLSYSYDNIGQTTTALELAKDTYARMTKIHGENNPALMCVLDDLASFKNELEQYDESVELCDKALKIYYDNDKTADLCDVKEAIKYKSIALAYLGRSDEAIQLMYNNMDISLKVFGTDTSSYYLAQVKSFAFIYYKAKEYEKALEKIDYAIKTQEENNIIYPTPYDKKVLKANILSKMGKMDEAEEILKFTLEKYGDDSNLHYRSDIYYSYAKLMKLKGNDEKALEYAEKCLELKKNYDRSTHEYKKVERLINDLQVSH